MVLSLVVRNAFRHKLRTALTIVGIGVAVMAFGLIRTVVDAWYAGVEAAAPNRLITRHAVSIIFPLPLAYREQILKIEGVEDITYASWFGGIYINPDNFFAQLAVDKDRYFKLFPEFIIEPSQFEAYQSNIKAAIAGRKLADRFGWRVGDRIPLIGTIYPGDWEMDLAGIYTGKDETVDESAFFFRWDYIDETMKQQWAGRAGQVGWYALKLSDPNRAAEISKEVDARFRNSYAETLTETEKAFQLSFVQMSGTILLLMTVMSWLIIGVILLVLINTMAMIGRERTVEHAYMRSMGFRPYHLIGLLAGESILMAGCGGILGLILLAAMVNIMKAGLSQWFPVFQIQPLTIILVVMIAVLVGVIAAIFPVQKAVRMRIVDGLRIVE